MTLWRRFGIYSVIGTITLMPLLCLPAMIGILVDESALNEVQAGWSASIRFLGAAAIALLMALHMHHLDLRKTAGAGFVLAALCDVLSAFTTDTLTVFLLVRFVAGLGAGAAYTSVLASFARLKRLDQGYALFVTLQFIVSGIALYLLPVFATQLGVTGMFLAFTALDIAGLWLTRSLPGKAVLPAAGVKPRPELYVLFTWATCLAALGFLVEEAANTAQFTYVERLGVSLAFSDQQIGTSMLLSSLAGIPGAFSIVLLGQRLGRMVGLTIGMAVSVGGLVILAFAGQFAPYLLGSVLIGFAWAFCLPYIQGLMASLDPHGSAVAVGSAASTVGGTIGPGLAALVISHGEYRHVFMFAIGLLLVSLVSFFIAYLRTARPPMQYGPAHAIRK